MQSIPFTEIRARLADALSRVESSGQPLLISRRGQTAGVLMSHRHYRALDGAANGFAARLARWRAECLPDGEAPPGDDEDPFADVRDRAPARPFDWPA